ncbi:MAG: hypothetical protein ACYTG0_11805 [Planctomycetota bacterium]|jgi:hypothetical protein
MEPGMHVWAGLHTGDVDYLQQRHEMTEIVEFSLGARRRSLNPNNFVVGPPEGDDSTQVIVEARPIRAGPIDCNELILLDDGKSLRIGDVKENPDVEDPKPDTTIIAGFYRRPDDDPWRGNPPIDTHTTTTVKKTVSRVQEAFALEFENGTSLKLGAGNWVLEYDGRLREIPVDLEHLKLGMQIVNGLDKAGVTRTVKLKSVRRIVYPENPYVLVEAVNLPWASVNGILVSVDFRDWHEGAVGLLGGTELAQPATLKPKTMPNTATNGSHAGSTPTSQRPATSGSSEPAVSLAVASECLMLPEPAPLTLPRDCKSGAELAGKPLVLWDPGLFRLAPGVVGGTDCYLSTRTIRVTAARDGKERVLECGPAQPLLVKVPPPMESVCYQYPADIRPGDRILVALPGALSAEFWPVKNARPIFYPWTFLYDVCSPQRQVLYESRAGEADVGFGNSLAYQLSVPLAGPRRARLVDIPSQDGRGPGSGRNRGPQSGQSRYIRNDARPPLVVPPEELLVDKIVLPANAMDLLRQRGRDLLITFDSERHKLPEKLPNSEILAFWKENLRPPSQLGQEDASGFLKLPGESAAPASTTLDAWFRELMRRREFFLKEEHTNTGYLTQVTAMEVVLASWLTEAGASETAEKLLLDLVELSVYAGCQHGDIKKLKARMSENLELPVLLHVANFVRRQSRVPKQEVLMSVSHPSLEAARRWAERLNMRTTIVKPNGKLSLSGLHAYWASRGGAGRTPFWHDIPWPDQTGNLNVSPSTPGAPPTADEQRIGREFIAWIQRMTERLLRESPPPGSVGPRLPQIIDEEFRLSREGFGT